MIRRAVATLCLVLSSAVLLAPAASAEASSRASSRASSKASSKDGVYRNAIKVKDWDEDSRSAAALKAASKGCRDDDNSRAKITVKKGERVATYRFDCVAGAALAT